MRTLNVALKTTKPFGVVAAACPSPIAGPGLEFVSVPAFAAQQWSADAARPASPVGNEATDAGYGNPIGSARPRGFGRRPIGGTDGVRGTTQELFHLMSRRDPRSWRPPA
jgi:hypothetical protein